MSGAALVSARVSVRVSALAAACQDEEMKSFKGDEVIQDLLLVQLYRRVKLRTPSMVTVSVFRSMVVVSVLMYSAPVF
jgi:hypothetical protein